MLFLRLYPIFLIHSLIFPLYAAILDHHLYERLPYSQPFYLQAGQPVHLYQVSHHHNQQQAPISRSIKGLLAFTEVQPSLGALTFISRQSFPSRKAVLPGLVVMAELMFSPLDLVDARTAELPGEMPVSKPLVFIRPLEKPPRG